ncbi:MAG: hypothetical protein JNG83_14685 [Opitutaceae bacterium]|nr:hypothetical protein [Opitutaceae bacterium]
MRPEQEFNRQELIKECQQRLRVLRARLRDMPVELRFAEGKLGALPAHITKMPQWAEAAAIAGAQVVTKPIAHLEPKAGQPYAIGDLMELLGHFEAMVAYIERPPREVLEVENELPQMGALQRAVSKQTAKAFLTFCRKILPRRSRRKGMLPSWEVIVERRRRLLLGNQSFQNEEGQIRGFEHYATRIPYLIWMFRHELEGHFTAPFVHGWLKRHHGESPSDKMVEAIITKLRKGPDKVGQP